MALQQQLDQLEEKRRKLSEELKEVEDKMHDLKKKRADELLTELKELGLDVPKARGKKGERVKKDIPCSVCGFKTEPLHDARKHRAQGKKKEPFTKEELEALGLKKAS